jgi:hypothetical protein
MWKESDLDLVLRSTEGINSGGEDERDWQEEINLLDLLKLFSVHCQRFDTKLTDVDAK